MSVNEILPTASPAEVAIVYDKNPYLSLKDNTGTIPSGLTYGSLYKSPSNNTLFWVSNSQVFDLTSNSGDNSDAEFKSVKTSDGSLSSPAYSFKNSTDSGLYLSNTDQVSLASNGNESLRSDSTGNITIPKNITVSGNEIINGDNTLSNSILTLNSTTQAFLPPRMSQTQKNNISTPTAGSVVYDTTLSSLCVYSGSQWNTITPSAQTILNSPLAIQSGNLSSLVISSGWTGTIQVGLSNNNVSTRILVTTNGAVMTYTHPTNIGIGTYRFYFGIEAQNNRGIHLVRLTTDGSNTLTVINFDGYVNLGGSGANYYFDYYFTTTTSNNPFIITLTANGKNANSAGFASGFVAPFFVTKIS